MLICDVENGGAIVKKYHDALAYLLLREDANHRDYPKEPFREYFAEAEASLEKKMSFLTENIATYCADGRTVQDNSWKKDVRMRFRGIPTLTKDSEPWSPIEEPKGKATKRAQKQSTVPAVKPAEVALSIRHRPTSLPSRSSGGGSCGALGVAPIALDHEAREIDRRCREGARLTTSSRKPSAGPAPGYSCLGDRPSRPIILDDSTEDEEAGGSREGGEGDEDGEGGEVQEHPSIGVEFIKLAGSPDRGGSLPRPKPASEPVSRVAAEVTQTSYSDTRFPKGGGCSWGPGAGPSLQGGIGDYTGVLKAYVDANGHEFLSEWRKVMAIIGAPSGDPKEFIASGVPISMVGRTWMECMPQFWEPVGIATPRVEAFIDSFMAVWLFGEQDGCPDMGVVEGHEPKAAGPLSKAASQPITTPLRDKEGHDPLNASIEHAPKPPSPRKEMSFPPHQEPTPPRTPSIDSSSSAPENQAVTGDQEGVVTAVVRLLPLYPTAKLPRKGVVVTKAEGPGGLWASWGDSYPIRGSQILAAKDFELDDSLLDMRLEWQRTAWQATCYSLSFIDEARHDWAKLRELMRTRKQQELDGGERCVASQLLGLDTEAQELDERSNAEIARLRDNREWAKYQEAVREKQARHQQLDQQREVLTGQIQRIAELKARLQVNEDEPEIVTAATAPAAVAVAVADSTPRPAEAVDSTVSFGSSDAEAPWAGVEGLHRFAPPPRGSCDRREVLRELLPWATAGEGVRVSKRKKPFRKRMNW